MKLEEIVADADVTEPTCMEKILIYSEQLDGQDEEFMQLLLERLRNETITWEQPWYQQSSCLTRPLKEIEQNGLPTFRTDAMAKEECDRINKNWRKFIKKYDLPDTPICIARWRNKDKSRNPRAAEERARQFVTAYLSRGLQRNLYQVYKHIVTYYGAPVKGAYSETEEKIMEVCFHHNPKKAVTYLSKVLSREPRGIYKRLRTMYQGNLEKKKLKWTLPLANKFLKLLMKYTGYSLEELKNTRFDKSVWLKLEEDMEQHYAYLQVFWYKYFHVQLFVKYDVKLNRLRKKILKVLRLSSYQVWTDIRWKEVLKHFPDGFSHTFLYVVCYRLISNYPNRSKAHLQDIVNYGLLKLKSDLYRKRYNKRIKSLALDQDGNLGIVRYDVKLKSTL